MPYAILPVEGGFKVVNTSTGKVHAEHTTKENAEAQVRLLRGVEHGMVPRSEKKRGRPRKMKSEAEHMGTTQEPVPADSIGVGAPVPRRPGTA